MIADLTDVATVILGAPPLESPFMGTEPEKLWDGRFSESTDAFVEAFTASVTFDQI